MTVPTKKSLDLLIATYARLLADLRATAREAVVGPLEDLLRFDPVAALAGYQGPRSRAPATLCSSTSRSS